MIEIRHERSFEDSVRLLNKTLDEWFAGSRSADPVIEQFPEPVYVKSANSIVTLSNKAYTEFFSAGVVVSGQLAASFLNKTVVEIAMQSDLLLKKGASQLQFQHQCLGSDGAWYEFLTYKRNLCSFGDSEFEIVGLSRPLRYERPTQQRESVQISHRVYRQLAFRDKRICQLIAEGHTAKEIAAKLDISVRTVETRRKDILHRFEFGHPIEIAKTLVRFEERGLEKFG